MIYFDQFLPYVREFIAMIGVVVITAGAVRSVYQLLQLVMYNSVSSSYIRLEFGDSVILGLEFMVGADIVGSMVSPDYYNLGLLAILVLVRTILSYFLNLELIALTPKQRHALK